MIIEIHTLITENKMPFQEAIEAIRRSLVPPGHEPHPFCPNIPESLLDKLRSIVGTYWCRASFKAYQESGVDFSLYVRVPRDR